MLSVVDWMSTEKPLAVLDRLLTRSRLIRKNLNGRPDWFRMRSRRFLPIQNSLWNVPLRPVGGPPSASRPEGKYLEKGRRLNYKPLELSD
jgi:hypothetical protein